MSKTSLSLLQLLNVGPHVEPRTCMQIWFVGMKQSAVFYPSASASFRSQNCCCQYPGAINTLNMITSMAIVNRVSCNKIAALGFDVLVVLDYAGIAAVGCAAQLIWFREVQFRPCRPLSHVTVSILAATAVGRPADGEERFSACDGCATLAMACSAWDRTESAAAPCSN